MARFAALQVACLWACMCAALCACGGRGCIGGNTGRLAVLVEHSGEVQRDHADDTGQFAVAADHASFFSGDALRTLDHATARLQLPASGSVLVQSATTIRLWRGKRAAVQLNVQTGTASVVAEKGPVAIQTDLGLAVLQAGSELNVRPGARGQRYEITLGRASLTTKQGRELNFGPGESIRVDEPRSLQASKLATDPLLQTVDAGTQAPADTAHAEPSDLLLQPGVSATIFDPAPPTRVRFVIPDECTHGARARVRGKSVFLSETRALLLRPGRRDYKIACLDEAGESKPPAWRGTLRVIRNPGTARLPKSAPRNTIEADGRAYTVLFQNIPPVLEVRWPDAPKASGYTLAVQLERGRELRQRLTRPRYVFAAGALPEGRHQLHFEQASGSARSRTTTVTLRFDNASPTASLKLPPVAGFAPAEHVQVAGIALPRARVSVFGTRLPLDPQGRFSGEVRLPRGARMLAVRIHHPRTGTRYYVRRVRPSP